MFDDLKRNGKVLCDGAAEQKFLEFAINLEEDDGMRKKRRFKE